MPNLGAFSTSIFPPWASLLGGGDEVQGQVGGPTEIRTEAGVYLYRDVGKLSAQYNGALARVQLSAQPAGASSWATDGWAPSDAEAGYEIRGIICTATNTANFNRGSVTLVDTLNADRPVALFDFLTGTSEIRSGLYLLTAGTLASPRWSVLPLFFRQQNTRWALRLDIQSTGGGAMAAPVLCDILYAESLPGVELDRG